MTNILSFKSTFGWISSEEENDKILSISFGKRKNNGSSEILLKLKKVLIDYFSGIIQ